MKKGIFRFAAILMAGATIAVSLAGCNNNSGSKNQAKGFYMVNLKAENAVALKKCVAEYKKETGVSIEVFSLGSGEGGMDTLRTDINSKKHKPAIYSVMNVTELKEWEGGGDIKDLNTASDLTSGFTKLRNSVPKNMQLTSTGKNSYGIPYNVEGYGYLVDTRMLADLFGKNKTDAVLADFKACTYDEFAQMVNVLDAYIKNGTTNTVTLNGKQYTLAAQKTDLTKKLNGVFTVMGSEAWTYGAHLVNIALDTVFPNAASAMNAKMSTVEELKNPLIEYAKALDLISSHAAGANSSTPRGAELINSTTHGYDPSIQLFAEGKSLFVKQGDWAYTNIQKANPDIVNTLQVLPVKMPFKQSDIKVNGLTVQKMNTSIPVFVPNYYVLNPKVSEDQQKLAQDFLVWLNTSKTGQNFVTKDFAFIPYNSNATTTKLGNSMEDSIISYMAKGDTIPNTYSGAPSEWTTNSVGKMIMQNYMIKAAWNEKDYESIANSAISAWKQKLTQ